MNRDTETQPMADVDLLVALDFLREMTKVADFTSDETWNLACDMRQELKARAAS